jgi:hypothetical protein
MIFNHGRNLFFLYSFIFLTLFIITISITEDSVKLLDEKITEENLEIEISNIKKVKKEYDDFNKNFNSLIEREKKERKRKTFNEKKFQEQFEKMYKEAEIFKEYFFKQRSKMSNFINKPKGKIAKNIIDLYHSTVEYSLECQDLIKEIAQKINLNKDDL